MEQELVLLYLSKLKREPTEDEKSDLLRRLTQGLTTIENISFDIVESEEYLSRQEDNIQIDYDSGLSSMTITPNQAAQRYDGVILANGKLCVKSNKVPFKSSSSVIAVNYDIKQLGGHNTNLLEGFDLGSFRFFSMSEGDVSISEFSQKLNLHTAHLTMGYMAKHLETHLESEKKVNITQQQRALQQYPYCFVQSFSVLNPGDTSIELTMYHGLQPVTDGITDIEYRNGSVGNESLFQASGSYANRGIDVFASALYKFKGGFTEAKVLGVNSFQYNVLKIVIEAGATATFDVILGMMTTADFDKPELELSRILTTIKDENLVADHNAKWVDIWNTANIMISKRTDIDPNELDEANRSVNTFQRNIKYSLYNIFSILRDDVNVDMNVLNLSALDKDGEIFWNAELFLVPLLLILRPSCAEVLLNFRFKQMTFAKSIASVHKNKGSQYPYREDISRYKDLFWSPSRPATAFNTGLIGINVWNYYRVTRDKYWLNEKGFLMLRNCAQFFESLFDDEFKLKTVVSLSGKEEEDNALTRYLGIHVIRNYIEACYELGFNVPVEIRTLYDNVKASLVRLTGEVEIQNGTTLPPKITVKKGDNNEFVFYNTETNALIGSGFGGQSGKQLVVIDTSVYEFTIESNVYFKLYDTTNTEVVADNLESMNALYSTQHGYTDGVFVVTGAFLSSYENSYYRDYSHGQSAFARESASVLQNVITRPDIEEFLNDTTYKSTDNLLETHLMLMYYYSRMFLNGDYRINNAEMIRSNYIFYGESGVAKPIMYLDDLLVKGNIESLLAQDMNLSSAKEFYIDAFSKTMNRMMKSDSEFLSSPWGNHDQYVLFIFNLLTSMFKFRIRGTISDHRFYTELFGVKREAGGAFMPKYWNHVTVKYNKKTVDIVNDIFEESV